jgi:hypothetical protein
VKLLILHLSEPDAAAAGWLETLATTYSFIDIRDENDSEFARRAVWLGEPFLITGNTKALDTYFAELDNDDLEVLKDCAYFWLLTEAEDYSHPRLPQDRLVTLSWLTAGQNVIRDAMVLLATFPRLKGLSKRMHFLREEINRISGGPVSPGYSVLIVGDSGVGKEEVAQSLFEASDRGKNPTANNSRLHAVGGAWLHMEPGMALTELIGLAPDRSQKGVKCSGLLKDFKNGALFIDDFEAAPLSVQETVLRIMSTERGSPALYRQVGGTGDEQTLVWLLFATNANILELRDAKKLREDFLYRFEDRVLVIPPLRDRPADFPAIAHAIWASLWANVDRDPDQLRSVHLKEIYRRRLKWEGNVRTLRALLALVVSMRCNPAHNHTSPGALIETILARGNTYWHWVRIVETEYFITGQSIIDEIRNADAGFDYFGSGSNRRMDDKQLLPSERKAQEVLTHEGWTIFKRLVSEVPDTKSGEIARISVRLARIIWYLSQREFVNWHIVRELTGVKSENTAVRDLAILANYDLKHPRKKNLRSGGPALLSAQGNAAEYVKVEQYFL